MQGAPAGRPSLARRVPKVVPDSFARLSRKRVRNLRDGLVQRGVAGADEPDGGSGGIADAGHHLRLHAQAAPHLGVAGPGAGPGAGLSWTELG
jgi:hypothetical protein